MFEHSIEDLMARLDDEDNVTRLLHARLRLGHDLSNIYSDSPATIVPGLKRELCSLFNIIKRVHDKALLPLIPAADYVIHPHAPSDLMEGKHYDQAIHVRLDQDYVCFGSEQNILGVQRLYNSISRGPLPVWMYAHLLLINPKLRNKFSAHAVLTSTALDVMQDQIVHDADLPSRNGSCYQQTTDGGFVIKPAGSRYSSNLYNITTTFEQALHDFPQLFSHIFYFNEEQRDQFVSQYKGTFSLSSFPRTMENFITIHCTEGHMVVQSGYSKYSHTLLGRISTEPFPPLIPITEFDDALRASLNEYLDTLRTVMPGNYHTTIEDIKFFTP